MMNPGVSVVYNTLYYIIAYYNKEVDIFFLQWTNNITYNAIIVIIYVHNIYIFCFTID